MLLLQGWWWSRINSHSCHCHYFSIQLPSEPTFGQNVITASVQLSDRTKNLSKIVQFNQVSQQQHIPSITVFLDLEAFFNLLLCQLGRQMTCIIEMKSARPSDTENNHFRSFLKTSKSSSISLTKKLSFFQVNVIEISSV